MPKYGLMGALLIVCSPAFAMEENDNQQQQQITSNPAGRLDTVPIVQRSAWQQFTAAVVWPFRPFEMVDGSDETIRTYKQKIVADAENIKKKDRPENYFGLTEQQKEICNYRYDKLQPVRDNKGAMPTRDQILIYKYGYKCCFVRPILRFVHGYPYSYLASGVYYAALTMGVVKGYQKIKELVQKKNSNLPVTLKNEGESQQEARHVKVHYPDCAWCRDRQKASEHNHTIEGSI